MKKALKITGIVLLVIVLIVAALAVWQWKYVSALIGGITMSADELGEQRLVDTENTITEVNKYMDSDIREMTDEEKEKIKTGEMSQTEVLAKIIAEATGIELPDVTAAEGEKSPDEQTPEQTPAPETTAKPKPVVSDYDQLVANCVSQLYGLQNQYTGQLMALVSRAKTQYNQQKKEVGSAAAKRNTAAMVTSEVNSLEGTCDAKVEAVLDELKSSLTAIGADTSIVGELRSSYAKEKTNQRKAYVNKYMSKI